MVRKIQHTMPPIGTILMHQTRGKGAENQILFAEIVKADNRAGVGILYDKKIYGTMSAAAYAAGGYSVDGWMYWKVKRKLKRG